MPFPTDMAYVRFEFGWRPSGSSSDIEIQDFGIWGQVKQEGVTATFEWDAIVDALAAQCVSAWTTGYLPANFSNNVYARRAIAYHYDQPHLEVLHRGEAVFTGDDAWAGSGDTFPPQTTVAVSTQAFEVGAYATQARRKRGRYYLPTPSRTGTGADGELGSSAQNAILEQSVAFFNELTNVLDVAGEPPASEIHFRPMVNSVAGQMANRILAVRVGRIFDTQRRRRNKLGEAYVADSINQ